MKENTIPEKIWATDRADVTLQTSNPEYSCRWRSFESFGYLNNHACYIREDIHESAVLQSLASEKAKIVELVDVLHVLLEDSRLGLHSRHFDSTDPNGSDCPVCIRQRRVSDMIREILKKYKEY